jgi:hypothetical protein
MADFALGFQSPTDFAVAVPSIDSMIHNVYRIVYEN